MHVAPGCMVANTHNQRHTSLEKLLQDLAENGKSPIPSLMDIRGCSAQCSHTTKCECSKCALYQAVGMSRQSTVQALEMKVLFPISNLDCVRHICDEMVAHSVAKANRLFPSAADVITSLSQFLRYRFNTDTRCSAAERKYDNNLSAQ